MKRRGQFTERMFIPASAPNYERFKVLKKVIPDSEVYICSDEHKNKREVVVKVEEIGQRQWSTVEREWSIYQKLSKYPDFDNVLEKIVTINNRLLVLQKKGIDLRKHYKKQIEKGPQFWTDTDLERCAVQMIRALQKCHSLGVVHLDPKPNNFVLDANDENTISLIDFDLSKEYRNDKGEHIPFRVNLPANQIFGNRAYLSLNGHKGEEQSRRDDMIFLGYSLVSMARDGLPWNREKKDQFLTWNDFYKEEKMSYSFEKLCVNKDNKILTNLVQYMEYCTKLKFDEEPNYSYLISLFQIKKSQEIEGYCL